MDFLELEQLYKHLEDNATDYKYPHQIANLFQWLRDRKNEAVRLTTPKRLSGK